MFNTGKFAQKTVLITGASRGIGKEIALKLAKDGANIVICAKTTEPHPKLPGTIYTAAEEVEKAGGKALACVVDVRDEKSATEAVESAVKKFGGIDILVNNASAISLTSTLDTPMKRYDLMQTINARGTFLMSQKCIPYLKSASNPHILNLSPPLTMDSKWFALHVAYTMSKYGMSMCVLGMHEELRQHGIAVNALWPRTAIWTSALEMISGGSSRAQNACRKPSIVADAAYAILSKNSRQYTGNFAIDEEVLREEGIRDFDQYAYSPGSPLMTDFFLPGAEHPGMPRDEKISEQRKKSRHAIKTADLATIINEIKSYITPELVKRISAVYEFTLTDGSDISNIYIDLKNENGAVMEGKPEASEVQFEMALSDFAEMFAGKLSSTEAFVSKKLKVKGSMMKAMQLEGLLKEAVRSKSKL